MKLLVVCQYYYPENFQITPICEELAKRGHQITVLTGLPNYPTGIIPEEYKKGHREEIINEVHVIRCKEHGRKKGIYHLAMNYLSFYRSASKKIDRIGTDYDLVFVYQLSPVLMGLPAIKYKKKHKVSLITYVCDLWPESMKMYIKKEKNVLYKMARKWSFKLYDNSDLLLCQSPTFQDYLINYHNQPENKIKYLPAFADDSYLKQDFDCDNGIIDFVFLGNLGIAQNLIKMLEAFKMVKDLSGYHVHFVGDGSCLNEMKQFVTDNNMNHLISFYGRRPVEEMPMFYKLADICLVSLKADSAVGLTLPSKVQGYMAAGKPILGMIDGSTSIVIKQSGCGICVPSNDVDGFSNAIIDILHGKYALNELGNKGREFFKNNFTKERCINLLEKFFVNINSMKGGKELWKNQS